MKILYLLFSLFFIYFSFGQINKKYVFNVELNNYNNAPIFIFNNEIATYVGDNIEEKDFFSKYTIINFYQTYPSSRRLESLNMFTFETNSINLMNDLMLNFPSKYLRIEDLTGQKNELMYYPNDYGTTSPITNLGADLNFKSYDYINVPKAWDYFPQNHIGNVAVGISDGRVDNSDIDFANKVTYINDSLFDPNFICESQAWHGECSAAIIGAQGNNSHGVSGICSDCTITNTPFTLDYNGILDLAYSGVKVINMSWAFMHQNDPTYLTGYIQSQQNVINEIHDMGVVLVASAGNKNSYYAASPNYSCYGYPASYENVISVSGVNHKNVNFTDEITHETYGDVSWYNEDLISPTGLFNNGVFTSFYEGFTTNSKVDICAPGWRYPLYGSYLLGCSENGLSYNYGDGTSGSAPYVSGTVALMLSLNPCLNPNEIEDILQLTSKNIEKNPLNSYFIGRIGSGKLETGDSVEFVSELMNSNGNAKIDGQDFWRFDFDLQSINNNLTISNQIFRDSNKSNFVAKNSININSNSDFKPNESGFIELKINQNISNCSNSNKNNNLKPKLNFDSKNNILIRSKLYPNPNNGNFTIKISEERQDVINVFIYDIIGKLIYSKTEKSDELNVKLSEIPNGVYFVKLTSSNNIENFKFIKQ